MVTIIIFIILVLFTASMTILLYTKPKYRHIAIPVDDLESMLEDKGDE